MTDKNESSFESFKVSGDKLLGKIKEIIKEGNALSLRLALWQP